MHSRPVHMWQRTHLSSYIPKYLKHEPVLNVEHDLLLVSVVPDEGVDGVTVGHPPNQTRVRRERNDRVAFNAACARDKMRVLKQNGKSCSWNCTLNVKLKPLSCYSFQFFSLSTGDTNLRVLC